MVLVWVIVWEKLLGIGFRLIVNGLLFVKYIWNFIESCLFLFSFGDFYGKGLCSWFGLCGFVDG